MKRILPLVTLLSIFSVHSAPAAPAIAVKVGTTSFIASAYEGMVLSGNNVVIYTNVNNSNSDVLLSAYNPQGISMWTLTIDSGADEVATAITSDSSGNVWLAGVRSEVTQTETSTSIAGVDNPDAVVPEVINPIRADMNSIALWKVGANGELLASWSALQSTVALIKGISVNTSGASIIGEINTKPFLLSANSTGLFGKLFTLGTSKTSFNDVARTSEGSSYIYGSSSETLQGKRLAGKRDGLLLTVDKNNKVSQLVRSSAPQAWREWQSSTQTFATTGSVVTGKVTESAITQFTKAFKPTWTLRIASTGQSRITTAQGLTYVALTSKGAVTGISGWKPTKPTLIVIAFDSRGAMKAAYGFPGLTSPLSLSYTRDLGVTGSAVGEGNIVSIFRLTSR